MPYLLGCDEAGYGPNLGPLIVACSVWEVPDPGADLHELAPLAFRRPGARRMANDDEPRWWVADSKEVYQPSRGLAALETSALVGLWLVDRPVESWCAYWKAIAHDGLGETAVSPWHLGFERPLPHAAPRDSAATIAHYVRPLLEQAGVRLLDLAARAVFPAEFNRLVGQLGNKSSLLSGATLGLAAKCLEQLPPGPALVLCDKHGGRNHYAALVQHHFPDAPLEVVVEGAARSAYRVRREGRPLEIHFQPKADGAIPAALASIIAKYSRELAMWAFNDFWTARVPGLRPTAGYPVDARRFSAEIAAAQAAADLPRELLWRER
jgi:ribonuclease HII